MTKSTVRFIGLIFILFVFRLYFGLQSNFTHWDYHQLYLMGLKQYTTGIFPYYGPDVVWSQTQIVGGLQSYLISIPLMIYPHPASPIVFVNILCFMSLSLLAWYGTKRFPNLPRWFIWSWTLTMPWILQFSTTIINQSYLVFFTIPLFIAIIELIVYPNNLLFSRKTMYFTMGICLLSAYQLHLSWVVGFFFAGTAFLYDSYKISNPKKIGTHILFGLLGLILPALLILPAYLKFGLIDSATTKNMLLNINNLKDFHEVPFRVLSIATLDMVKVDLKDITSPLAVILMKITRVIGYIHMILALFLLLYWKKMPKTWKPMAILTLASFVFIFVGYLFAIRPMGTSTLVILSPFSLVSFLFVWDRIFKWKYMNYFFYFSLFLSVTCSLLQTHFWKDKRSVFSYEEKIQLAINSKESTNYEFRRLSINHEKAFRDTWERVNKNNRLTYTNSFDENDEYLKLDFIKKNHSFSPPFSYLITPRTHIGEKFLFTYEERDINYITISFKSFSEGSGVLEIIENINENNQRSLITFNKPLTWEKHELKFNIPTQQSTNTSIQFNSDIDCYIDDVSIIFD